MEGVFTFKMLILLGKEGDTVRQKAALTQLSKFSPIEIVCVDQIYLVAYSTVANVLYLYSICAAIVL